MINVNEVYQYIEFLSRKAQSGGTFTPNEFNLVLPRVVKDLFRKYYGVPEEYQVGHPEPHIGADNTQLVRDYLSVFLTTKTHNVTDGTFPNPADYAHKSSARVVAFTNETVSEEKLLQEACTCDGGCDCKNDVDTPTLQQSKATPKKVARERFYPITFVTDEQFNWCMNSTKRFPSIEFPIARMKSGYIEIAPTKVGTVELTYYRNPKNPFWNSHSVNGQTVYSPAGTIDIELPEVCGTEVVLAMLGKLGISIREEQLINWADRTRQKGS
jgi:hypothetical protein